MACYHPLPAYRSRTVNPATGKRGITFDFKEAYYDLKLEIPCGRCIGCRLKHSKDWAIRAYHEASLYDKNCFLTLTYRNEDLPDAGSLNPNDPVLFMKRLRKKYGSGIRSYGCAEYGDKFSRPHYHICLFNFDFNDKQFYKKTKGDNVLYTAPSLTELWPHGFSIIGSLTFESAAYVARYVTKKITGKNAPEHYEKMNEFGELIQLEPERPICVSRRPGIGKPWLDKYMKEVFEHDSIVMKGLEMKPPKYYSYRHEIDFPEDHGKVRLKRKVAAKKNSEENSTERLFIREMVQKSKSKKLIRSYEND